MPAARKAPAKKGVPAAAAAKAVFCIECGEKNPPIAKFCFSCGTRLAAPEV
jgi:ribosomal protein L40E